jgi:hypothetical protein
LNEARVPAGTLGFTAIHPMGLPLKIGGTQPMLVARLIRVELSGLLEVCAIHVQLIDPAGKY